MLWIRHAAAEDTRKLARLAEVDSHAPLPGPVLVAGIGEELLAAVSLRSGEVIADPFRPTLALVELLLARARQLHDADAAATAGERARAPRRWPGVPGRGGVLPPAS
jgi:hypothetical protein